MENAGAKFQLWDMEKILMENWKFLKDNELLTVVNLRALSAQIMAEKILKDIERYL